MTIGSLHGAGAWESFVPGQHKPITRELEVEVSGAEIQACVFLFSKVFAKTIQLNSGKFDFQTKILVGPPNSQSHSSERTSFGSLWTTSWIFSEIICGHFPWNLKEICKK